MSEYGPCCICESGKRVHNIVMLSLRSPYKHGWGCAQCGLPSEGASAIVCDSCMKRYGQDVESHLKFFCVPSGSSYVAGRAPYAELADQPAFDHDMAMHPEG